VPSTAAVRWRTGSTSTALPTDRENATTGSFVLVTCLGFLLVGPHFAACLVARDLGDTGPDHERRFEFVLSHDRELAVDVAISLMRRLADGA
jgi:hypothetical protein